MAGFVERDGIQVVGRLAVAAELIRAVEEHVAGPGRAGPGKRRGGGHGRRLQHAGSNADIAEARVALHGAGHTQRQSAILSDAHVYVGVDGPGLEGAQDRRFPVRGAVLGIQEMEQSTRSAAGTGAVGREAEREMSRVGPHLAEDTWGKAVLKLFQTKRALGFHGACPFKWRSIALLSRPPAARNCRAALTTR